MSNHVRIGTRGSTLALKQAQMVANRFARLGLETELCPIVTTGDAVTDRPLADIGGKGLFTKEIDRALLAGEIDCAVHSLKDMESQLPSGIVIGAVLERADPRDVFIGQTNLPDLPSGAKVGTSAVRRRAQLLKLRPDLEIMPLRGNVDTRLNKWRAGQVDGIILAKAGLDRLNLTEPHAHILDTGAFLPAAGQGIVAIAINQTNARLDETLDKLNHAPTWAAAEAERAFLARLDGSCRAPIAACAQFDGDTIALRGILFARDGTDHAAGTKSGPASAAKMLGETLAEELMAAAPPAVLANLKDER